MTRQAISPRLAIRILPNTASHPEDAEAGRLYRGVEAGGNRQCQGHPRIDGVDDPIIPQSRARIIGMTLSFVLRTDRRLEFLVGLAVCRPPYLRQYRGRLLTAHDRDPSIRPHPQKAWRISSPAHAVIAGAKAAADNHCEFRHCGSGDGSYHLGTILGDAARLVFAADHKPGDVLQKDERDPALRAKLDEVRALQCAFREQDAVIGENADWIAPDPRKTADQRLAVKSLEFVELAAIDETGDDLPHLIRLARVRRDDAVDLLDRVERLARRGDFDWSALCAIEIADDAPGDAERVVVVERIVIGDAGDAAMHFGAAELLGGDDLAGRGADQRRPAEKDRPLPAHDDALVGHRRDIGPARRTRAHDERDLWNPSRREARLVEEDTPEMVAVGKDLVLCGQKRSAGIDKV